jgi:T5orf172 domain
MMSDKNVLKEYTDEQIKVVYEKWQNEMISEFQSLFSKIPNKLLSEIYFTTQAYKNKNFGYVYFLYNKDTGLTKIGHTTDLVQRMKTIRQTFRNYIGIDPNLKLTLLLYSHQSLLKKLEKEMHEDLIEYKKYGEWFDLKESPIIAVLTTGECINIGETSVVIDDCHDFHFYHYEPFEEDFDFNIYEVIKYISLKNDIPYTYFDLPQLFHDENKYLEIYETCMKDNIGIVATYIKVENDGFVPYKKGIKSSTAKKLYDICELKKECFNIEEVEKAIEALTK